MPSARSQLEAERVRSDLGLGTGYIDVFDVARRLGAELYFHPFGIDGVEGAFKRVRGVPFILVNADRPLVRRRFTTAHEIGHLRLAPNDAGIVESISVMDRSTNPEERNANRFAAYLLMDAQGVRDLTAEAANPWMMVAAVCNQYTVSPSAAAIHLGDLGLLTNTDKENILRTYNSREGRQSMQAAGYEQVGNPRLTKIDRIDPRHLDDALREYSEGQYSKQALVADFDLTDHEVEQLLKRHSIVQRELVSELDFGGFDEP